MALFAACQVMAQQQGAEHSTVIAPDAAQTRIGNVKAHWLAPAQPAVGRNDRETVHGLSPRAWTTTVGWHPGESAFPDLDGKNFSTGMPLLWAGHEPWP